MNIKRIEDFRPLLSGSISKKNVDSIVESVHHHPEDFERIYQLSYDADIKVAWRATWACEKLAIMHPDWFDRKQNELINKLTSSSHSGIKRITLSILYTIRIPDPFPVNLLDYCFSKMFDVDEAAGLQSLSIKMAYKLCKKEPDLIMEFKMYCENAELEYYSTAVITSVKKILKEIH